MATRQHSFLASLLFASLVAFAMAHPPSCLHAAHDNAEATVQGVVYCQCCGKAGTQLLAGGKPLPFAKVAVSCRDNKDRVCPYEPFPTDGTGHFYAPLRGLHKKCGKVSQPLGACTVRLLSSADPHCKVPTNVNHGISGAPLRRDTETVERGNYEAVVYSVAPLAFRPTYCPQVGDGRLGKPTVSKRSYLCKRPGVNERR